VSEALGLTWDPVDWDGRTIRLAPADTKKGGEAGVFPFADAPDLQVLLEGRWAARRGVCVFHRDGKPIKTVPARVGAGVQPGWARGSAGARLAADVRPRDAAGRSLGRRDYAACRVALAVDCSTATTSSTRPICPARSRSVTVKVWSSLSLPQSPPSR
jgi:hypothetical protein